eukprot:gene27421-36194_t
MCVDPSMRNPISISSIPKQRFGQMLGIIFGASSLALTASSEKTLAVPVGNIPTSSDITTDEARNAALMVQRCLKQVREMELAYKEADLQKVERILTSTNDFKYFEQAANVLLQTEMLSMGDKVELQGMKKYFFVTLRRMKEAVKSRHSIPKVKLLSWRNPPEESVIPSS